MLFEQECDALINQEKVNAAAVELAENVGIIFVDEIDKVVASEHTHGADVSRQGVQRDLLPIVEGTTVQTRYGYVRTDHILFIAAGAFHRAKPSDLMPELQGRFPIRVELQDLIKDDFVRILTRAEGRADQAIRGPAGHRGRGAGVPGRRRRRPGQFAFQVNQTTQNIGARRLYTIMERLLEELSFEAPDMEPRAGAHQCGLRQRAAGRAHPRRRPQQVHLVGARGQGPEGVNSVGCVKRTTTRRLVGPGLAIFRVHGEAVFAVAQAAMGLRVDRVTHQVHRSVAEGHVEAVGVRAAVGNAPVVRKARHVLQGGIYVIVGGVVE